MIPKSLSASSVQVFESCPARWTAEYFNRAGQPSTTHADLGSAVHYALEQWVKNGYHEKHHKKEADNYRTLADFYTAEYERLFTTQERYAEGLGMLQRWWERSNFVNRVVLSTESKASFPIKASGLEVPFNYIWDRAALIEGPHQASGQTWIEVIDYKTISRPLSPDNLKNKIQARCYGLAAQVAFPEADRIWVTFDLLRFDPVGIVFSREDNIATYRYLQRILRRINDTDENDPPEVLNQECHWCVRKQVCTALRKHADVGGVLGTDDIEAVVTSRYQLENQKKGVDAAIRDLDEYILAYAEREETFEIAAGDLDATITARRSRALDSERAVHIIGPDLLAEYGNLGVTAVDKLLKDKRLTADQKQELKDLIHYRYSDPSVKVNPKNPIDTE